MVVLAMGCESDSDLSSGKGTPVSFRTGIVRSETRATTTRDNVWSVGDQIAISDGSTIMAYQPESDGSAVALKPINSENTLYWPIDKGSKSFEAWYPYTASKPLSWEVAVDQNDESVTDDTFNKYDLLYASSGEQSNGSTITLDFYHQMAHIIVYIRALAWEGQEITSVTFGDNNVAVESNVTMGKTGDSPTAIWNTNVSDQTKTITLRYQPDTYAYECVLPPQTGVGSTGNLLVFHTKTDITQYPAQEGETNKEQKDYHYKGELKLEAGKQYSFFIRLERVGLSVASSIEDWTFNDKDDSYSVKPTNIPIGVGSTLDPWGDKYDEVNDADNSSLDFILK